MLIKILKAQDIEIKEPKHNFFVRSLLLALKSSNIRLFKSWSSLGAHWELIDQYLTFFKLLAQMTPKGYHKS